MPRPPLKSFHSQIVDSIGSQIVTGRIPEGAQLPPEAQLAEHFGASRLVIREAMKTLAAKGLVAIRPRTGTRVLPAARWSLFDAQVLGWYTDVAAKRKLIADLIELRGAIEPLAARLTARRRSREELAEIRAAYEAMDRAENQADYIAADLRFHGAVIRASGNAFIRQLEGALSEVLMASFKASSGRWEPASRALSLHRNLLSAIEAKDPIAAEAAVEALIQRATERIGQADGRGRG